MKSNLSKKVTIERNLVKFNTQFQLKKEKKKYNSVFAKTQHQNVLIMPTKNWIVKHGKINHFLLSDITSIGRNKTNAIIIKKHRLTSRKHCSIEIDGNIPILINHSRNGTILNGIKCP